MTLGVAEGFAMPPGYRMTIGGESEEEGEARALLLKHLPVLVTVLVLDAR